MSYSELLDWASFATMFPFEEHDSKLEVQIALLCQLVSNFHLWFAGKKPQHTLEDFIPGGIRRQVEADSDEPKKATISSDVVTGLLILSSMSDKD